MVLLQELNPDSASDLMNGAKLDWLIYSAGASGVGLSQGRRRAAAVGGRGPSLVHDLPELVGLPLPERVKAVRVSMHEAEFVAVSYHAPPVVSWGYWKVEQALVFLDWLNDLHLAAILGADANTPEVDNPDFAQTRTHWHSGTLRLGELPGDDLLWGPGKTHRLSDSYRLWLAD